MAKNLSRTNYAIRFIGKEVTIEIDRPLGSIHPKHNFVYQVNYGFVPGTVAPDGEAVDAYLLGINEPLRLFKGTCIAIIHRIDDDDDKLVVVPKGMENITDETIYQLIDFQEKFFKSQIITLNYETPKKC